MTTHAATGQDGHIQSIRYLRAVAALLVVVFHAVEKAGGSFKTGAAGVDLFFVISGFVMWVATAERHTGPREFLTHRVIRILPLYWGVTLLVAALAVIAPALLQSRTLDQGRLLASLLFLPHLDQVGMPWPLFVPGWTLNYEAFFYAVFALALLLPRQAQAPAVTGLLLGLVLLGLLARPEGAVAATWTSPLLLEFLSGLWLGHACLRRRLPDRRLGLGLLAAGVAGLAALEGAGYDADAWRAIAWGGPAFLVVAGAVAWEAAGRFPRSALLGRLGDSSYSLYLSHPLVIPVVWKLLGSHAGPVAFAIAGIAVSCAVGGLCFLLVERPVTAWLRRATSARAVRMAVG